MDIELLRANLVRTMVPLLVGALVSLMPFLAGNDTVSTLIGFGVSGGYYAFFRIAETRYPWLGVFLGKKMPHGTAARADRPAATGTPAEAAGLGSLTFAGSVEVAFDSRGTELGVTVGGQPVPGVASVCWTATVGEPTRLTIELREAPLTQTP